jgi:hypothetical protein
MTIRVDVSDEESLDSAPIRSRFDHIYCLARRAVVDLDVNGMWLM